MCAIMVIVHDGILLQHIVLCWVIEVCYIMCFTDVSVHSSVRNGAFGTLLDFILLSGS